MVGVDGEGAGFGIGEAFAEDIGIGVGERWGS